MTTDLAGALRWRFVGPYRGGRVMAVSGVPGRRGVAYCGSSSGGVWRSIDGGASWHNISDGYFARASVGALALAPSDPRTIYAGMGECGFRANVTHGDGVYRSRDGGASWEHLGLAATQNIARIVVHPRDPRTVYVAALGHRFGPNPERGIYRSIDGGEHWDQVLFVGERTGAIDLAMDPSRPWILYAAFWEAQRYPWGYVDGGQGSGIYKSVDGGHTWALITGAPGLPEGPLGRIGLCVSPAAPDRLYAIVEAERGGIYRSSDGGASWAWTNADRNFLVRGWYFGQIVADPRDPDTVWLPNRKLWRSRDGGRTFLQLHASYWDQHALWIDPDDEQHLVLGNDGGAAISFNGAASWSTIFNQPTAELYHAAADTRFPYRVYSAQQDSSTFSFPSRSDLGPISQMDWFHVGGGESSHIAVRQDNPDIVYASDLAGVLTRYDHATGALRDISVWPEYVEGWPPASLRYRSNWSAPVIVSRHDPDCLYTAANIVFRSRTEGASWEAISPDLTRFDPEKLDFIAGSSGTRHIEEGSDYFCTIASLAESPLRAGVLWTGSDDGLIHVSQDGGASWRNVTPPDFPDWAACLVEPSPHQTDVAYIAATRHKLDDFAPYIYRTSDFGASWQRIDGGIPRDEFVRVVRADPARPGLLYAGTEIGVYYTRDDGRHWHTLRTNLPRCAVYDLLVKEHDLIAATHGRGLWILDDLTPLHHLDERLMHEAAALLPPRPAYRLIRAITGNESYMAFGHPHAAPNPPLATVCYYLRERPADPIQLALFDAQGTTVARYSSAPPPRPSAPLGPLAWRLYGAVSGFEAGGSDDPQPRVQVGMLPHYGPETRETLSSEPGLHRVAFDLLYPELPLVPGSWSAGATRAPLPPGRYTVQLTIGTTTVRTPLVLLPDPRMAATPEDYADQHALLVRIRDLMGRMHDGVRRLRALRPQLARWVALGASPSHARPDAIQAVRESAARILDEFAHIEDSLIQPRLTHQSGELAGADHPAGLSSKCGVLFATVASVDAAPTAQAYALFDHLHREATAALDRLDRLLGEELHTLNGAIHASGLPAISLEG